MPPRAYSGTMATALSIDPTTWLGSAVIGGIAVLIALVAVLLVRVVLARLGRRAPWAGELGRRIRLPLFVMALLIAVWIAAGATAPARQTWWPVVAHGLLIAAILIGAWLLGALASFGFERLLAHEEDVEGALGRKRRTQIVVIHRLVLAIIGVLALGAVLFSFPGMRVVGTSLLASAGIVSIVAGLAAQSVLGNLIAGVQLAFTNAIRVGDIVVVEGEWGRIGEINLTYVVVHIWDERRLVLPSSYFTTTGFETWTRTTDEILGTVFMDLDWRVPMDAVRTRFQEIVEASELWDERRADVLVTGSQGGFVTLRFVVSAADANDMVLLRAHVREEIMTWLQREHPTALPVQRVILDAAQEGA